MTMITSSINIAQAANCGTNIVPIGSGVNATPSIVTLLSRLQQLHRRALRQVRFQAAHQSVDKQQGQLEIVNNEGRKEQHLEKEHISTGKVMPQAEAPNQRLHRKQLQSR
ncbi:uncharacterized protein PAC_16473 [Phialocephala subalpina]|uniref:Uncharacterized protein n=1 Tax=Phialocephala subalpina TaxID=576137 RepID=A0A1L7XNH0_9HELO|nr:uncharacterized protein PAC_16473 [Phialocephala subalpina]